LGTKAMMDAAQGMLGKVKNDLIKKAMAI